MKIDWKHLATTPGYRSLKAAYTRDVQESEADRVRFKRKPMREKPEFLKLFNWVICRAKHYAIKQDRPIEEVLNEWEEKRDYWWLNYYQSSRQPKLHSKSLKPEGINGMRKYFKTSFYRNDPQKLKNYLCKYICKEDTQKSTKLPKRWGPHQRKARGL